jgi:hypothetical protein
MTVFNTPQFSGVPGFSTVNVHDNTGIGVRVLSGSVLSLTNQARIIRGTSEQQVDSTPDIWCPGDNAWERPRGEPAKHADSDIGSSLPYGVSQPRIFSHPTTFSGNVLRLLASDTVARQGQ